MILMKDIVRDGDPVLRQEAAKVSFPLSEEDQKLADDMMEYLKVSQDPDLCKKIRFACWRWVSRTASGRLQNDGGGLSPI